MDEKLSIRINIADRYYPLRIDRKDNEKVLQYKQKYTDKDAQDFLAMAALQFVIKVIDGEETQRDDEIYERIRAMSDELEGVLGKE
jgi:hypothetical protein